jgi:3-hydroxyisobutyrate dehydrogenase-like beta-hydroxyacid dehydrogenase
MSDVTVIGLGAMGAALAKTLLEKGHSVTVWNRTAAKAAPLVDAGATAANSPKDAIAASPVSILCVGNYADSREVLDTTGDALAGKTLVQLTSGSGTQAVELAAWAAGLGADYLDGVIMAYPSEIGAEETTLMMAGAQDVWSRCQPLLVDLGGGATYLGENLNVPPALDAALIAPLIGTAMGAIQGALFCEKEGFPVESYREMMASMLPVAQHQIDYLLSTIAEDRFGAPEAALQTYAAGVTTMVAECRSRGINGEFVEYVDGLLRRSVAAGYGEEELSAVIKVLR